MVFFFKDIFFECDGVLHVLDDDSMVGRVLEPFNCLTLNILLLNNAVYFLHFCVESLVRAGSNCVAS